MAKKEKRLANSGRRMELREVKKRKMKEQLAILGGDAKIKTKTAQ